MLVLTTLLLLALGVLIGALGGLFGIGGGLFAIPLLVLGFDMSQQMAQGTALVMVAPTVLLGLRRHDRLGNLDRRNGAILALSAVLFTLLAAMFVFSISSENLRLAFGLFVGAVALQFGLRTLRQPPALSAPRLGRPWLALVGAFGGAVSGLFGVGGALFAPPLLTQLFGMRQAVAQAHSLALVAPGTLVALAVYTAHQAVDWRLGLPLALGGALGVSPGVRLAHRLPERVLRLLFCGLLLVVAVLLVLGV